MNWLPKKSLVVPVDLSEFSMQALDVALQLVDDSAAIHIVHVLTPVSPMEPGVVWGDVDEESRRRHAATSIQRAVADRGLHAATISILVGSPAHRIAEYASEADAELIVLPSHGRTGAMHMLIGSTAERAVRFAHCPVLVLRN